MPRGQGSGRLPVHLQPKNSQFHTSLARRALMSGPGPRAEDSRPVRHVYREGIDSLGRAQVRMPASAIASPTPVNL